MSAQAAEKIGTCRTDKQWKVEVGGGGGKGVGSRGSITFEVPVDAWANQCKRRSFLSFTKV